MSISRKLLAFIPIDFVDGCWETRGDPC